MKQMTRDGDGRLWTFLGQSDDLLAEIICVSIPRLADGVAALACLPE
jgi:hypothetical protein